MRDGKPGFKPLIAVLLGGFLLSGCTTIQPYVDKAKTVISDTFNKLDLEVEPTGADKPPFNDPA